MRRSVWDYLAICSACVITLFIVTDTPWGAFVTIRTFEHVAYRFMDSHVDATARGYIMLLAARRFVPIDRAATPSIPRRQADKELRYAASLLPIGQPNAVRMVAFRWNTGITGTFWFAEYELSYNRASRLIDIVLSPNGNGTQINEFKVYELNAPLEVTNRFWSGDKSLAQYVFLFLVFVVGAFVLYTLWACALAHDLKLRWLWILLSCVGVGQCVMNWSSGQVAMQLFWLRIPAVALSRSSPFEAWVLVVSIPVGAMAYWVWIRSRATAQAPLQVTALP